ncbi:hypothetical protein ALC60_00849 [Trachymyrmex zeteki]|uniref:CCHC-type domain-containing protein n=1 Tax=Mycetomoellerius zeteki TaxID=64791 RepID=A0A151XIG8_9HYME|nr:hypothetical protein ALC60_00849 [Trachymyrmex zeteki]
MCKCFISGLKPEIEQRIARNLNVQEIVADVLRIERELRSMTDLRQGHSNTAGKIPDTVRLRETCQICYKEGHSASNCRRIVNLENEILICQICKKRGHSADKCRLRDPRTHRSVNVIQGNNIICQLCSKSGHNAKFCKTNSNNTNNNNQNKPSVIYQWCDKPGHSANNCWKKQNDQRNSGNKEKTVCQICNNFGHIAKDCRSRIGQNTISSSSLFCRYCKEQGHFLDNCELHIASNNRRRVSNQGNSDGPSKPVEKNASEVQPVTVNLDRHSRVPTVQIRLHKTTPDITFMLDIGSGPNIIKENLVPKGSTVNHSNILKLNGINESSPRSESSFYVKIENPEIKIGYIPKLKIAHGIYLEDTIVENVSGKHI